MKNIFRELNARFHEILGLRGIAAEIRNPGIEKRAEENLRLYVRQKIYKELEVYMTDIHTSN